jgi:hypothetical protein
VGRARKVAADKYIHPPQKTKLTSFSVPSIQFFSLSVKKQKEDKENWSVFKLEPAIFPNPRRLEAVMSLNRLNSSNNIKFSAMICIHKQANTSQII